MRTIRPYANRACMTLLITAALAASLAGCGKAPPQQAGKPTVFVSVLPQAHFVEKVAGARVRVEVLVQPGQSPHTFTPTTDQMARLGESRLYLRIGVEFEKRVVGKIRSTHPDLRIVDTREGIELRTMTGGKHDQPEHEHDAHVEEHAEEHAEHEHAAHDTDEHHHASGEPDPHVWLNPRNVKIMAGHIAEALKELDPAHAEEYERNAEAFQRELDDADARVAAALAPLRGKEFMVFHPAFGYFADAYGLTQFPVEIEGKNPDAKSLANLIRTAKDKDIRVIFVQPQFSPKRAEAIAEEIGGAVVPMDPLARDYIANLLDMAAKIESALGSRPEPRDATAP